MNSMHVYLDAIVEPADYEPSSADNSNPAWASILPILLIVLVAAVAIVISRRRK